MLAAGAITATGVMSIGCGFSTAAGQWIDAKSHVWILGKDKIPYRIDVDLIVPATVQGESVSAANVARSVVLSIYRCPAGKCANTTPYVVTVAVKTATTKPTDAQYDDSNLNAINTRITGWGSTLDVTWKSTAPSSPVDGSPGMEGTDLAASGTWKATATVSFLGVTCTDTAATVYRTTRVSPLGYTWPQGKTLPAKAVPGIPAAKRCTTAPK